MPISNFLSRSALRALAAIERTTNVDIRVHGEENVPDEPVLYTVNHFTRMETLFLPYIIHRETGKLSYSLAFHDFFKGGLGRLMSNLGAISTRNPERDKILGAALLRGDSSVIIFPEGQMIKDKKIVEKGKFLIYNSGMRRPPHTGSARLALMTEFHRRKIARLLQEGNEEALYAFINYYDLRREELNQITRLETNIVPINITYYPVRARENAISRLVEKYAGNLSDRFLEELQVEGTMILSGVDIDVNFGEALPAGRYLERSKKMKKQLNEEQLFLSGDLSKIEVPLRKISANYMGDYMSSIYRMTTVNHDHILSWFICSYPTNKIPLDDLKARAYLAIRKIKDLKLATAHSTLYLDQEYLLSDDLHDKLENLLATAYSNGLISRKGMTILRNQNRFSSLYEFHTLRQDNILEVLHNEIEPIRHLVRVLQSIMIIPPPTLRRKIHREFLRADFKLYRQERESYRPEKETHTEEIGRPFFLKNGRKHGILLIHGYMAAPEEMRELGEHLHEQGYTVYGVRLRGHGTSPEDLASRGWEEWYDSVNRGYIILKHFCKDISLCGFSTGAGLALLQSARKDFQIHSVIAISAPLRLQDIRTRFASAITFWNDILKRFNVQKGSMEFVDNHPENPHINYHRNPVHGIFELEKLMKTVEKELPDVRVPTLVIQGSDDPVVHPESAMTVFSSVGTAHRELFRIYSQKHGIVRGKTSAPLARRISLFLEEQKKEG